MFQILSKEVKQCIRYLEQIGAFFLMANALFTFYVIAQAAIDHHNVSKFLSIPFAFCMGWASYVLYSTYSKGLTGSDNKGAFIYLFIDPIKNFFKGKN